MSSAITTSLEIRAGAKRLLHSDGSPRVLYALLALALVRGLLYAVLSPPFDAPDEPEHLRYVAYLATSGRSGPIGLEGYQPPGYYALMVPAYWLVAGQPAAIQLYAVRAASVLLLLGTVLFTWLAARRLAPGNTFVPVVAAGFVALQPALAYIGASANNGTAADLMGAVLTYLVVLLLSGRPPRWVAPATVIAIGAAILTKGTILSMVMTSAAVLAMSLFTRIRHFGVKRLPLYAVVAVSGVAALVESGPGQRMLETTAAAVSMLLNLPAAWHVVQQSNPLETVPVQFISFWTAYLAGALHPALEWYFVLAATLVLAAAGYAIAFVVGLAGRQTPPRPSAVLLRVALLCMFAGVWLTIYLVFLGVWDPNNPLKTDALHGRYLHVAIAPLALLFAEGWALLTPARVRAPTGWGLLTLLAAFDVVSLVTLAGHYAWR